MTHSPTAPFAAATSAPIRGNVTASLGALLSGLGITDVDTRDSVEDTIAAELAKRGFEAQVRDLRWGTLTLLAQPQTARLLRFDVDNLIAAIGQSHPGVVTRVEVRVARPGG